MIQISQNLQDQISDAIKTIKADYAEIRAEEFINTRIVYRGEDPDLIAEPYSLGFFVRVLINGSWGITKFNDIKNLKEKIAEAVSFAKLKGQGDVNLSDTPQVTASISHSLIKDFREISLNEKVKLVKKYNELLLKADKNVKSTNTIYADSFHVKFFVNSRGSKIFQIRPSVRLSSQAVGAHLDVLETARNSYGHVGGYEVIEGLEEEMIKTGKEAVVLAKTPKVKSGVYTVILDPYMAGTFAHEAFGHFSEADHQYENPKILEQMSIGRKLGSDIVNIVDDPGVFEGWGNFVYDDEGTLGKRVSLLSNGVITSRLHSLETSAKLGEEPNGRARAEGFSHKPIIRMSNTFFLPGKSKLEDMVKSIDHGILVRNWIGGMTAMENFTFTAVYGEMIEKGKITKKVRGVKLSGNVFETLQNIEAISDDFAHDQGTCGKGGQYIPVGSGGGFVKINKVTVGGEG